MRTPGCLPHFPRIDFCAVGRLRVMILRISALACVAMLATSALALHELSLQPDGRLHAYVFDVGQGDSLLLISPSGKTVLIDGGPDLSLLEHLGNSLPFLQRTIDLLVLTHPDSDHIAALPELLRRYDVEQVLLSGVRHASARYMAFLDLLAEKRISVMFADPATDIDIGDGVVLDTLWPPKGTAGTEPDPANNSSVVFRVLSPDGNLLLAGDIERQAERALLATGADLRAGVLKVPHHGSRTSSSTGFLLAVAPDTAVISVGEDNSFGHPHEEITQRYAALGIDVRSTAQEGTILLGRAGDFVTHPLAGSRSGATLRE